ncbi:MAG: C25 family cysteine peptidase [bacterium]
MSFSCRLVRMVVGWVWVGLFLAASTGLASQAPATYYQGSLDTDQLHWSLDADGAFFPVLPGTRELAETDKPVLARQNLNLLVPVDSRIVGVEVIPLATHVEKVPGPLSFGGLLYTDQDVGVRVERLEITDEVFPLPWGEFGGTHVWRGYRILSVQLYPLKALRNAAGEWTSIEVLDEYGIRLISDAGASFSAVVNRERQVPGERQQLDSMLRRMCANPEVLGSYLREDGIAVAEPKGGFQPSKTPSLDGSSVRYLIITNETLAPSFEPLAAHKTALGFPAVVQTVEWIEANYRHGCDVQETIRHFIREAYERWGVEFVLLGGDSDVIPARYITSTYYPSGGFTEIPTDLYFGCLEGNWNDDGDYIFGEPYTHYLYPGDECDLGDEVYVGRAPVSNPTTAGIFVDKTIRYENSTSADDFLNNALFLAEVLFPSEYTPGDYIILDGAVFAQAIIDDFFEPCTDMNCTALYETYALTDTLSQLIYPGSFELTRQATVDSLNSGDYGLINQIGHGFYFNMSVGDGNFGNADADALVNGDHYFMLYALNCASAAFDQACLMERFLQNGNGGSVVSIGSSRSAFPHTANDYQREFFDQLCCELENRAGALITLSRAPFLSLTYYNTVDRWTHFNYCLLGDPALPIWTATPGDLTVTAPTALNTGDQQVAVNVTDGALPVEGAMVCLAKSADDYVYGLTDINGDVDLDFTPTSVGSAELTISALNMALTSQTLSVTVGGGAYIALTDITVIDDGSDGSSGNGNGQAEAGEKVACWLQVRDTGSGGGTGCSAVLSSFAGDVTILDGTATIGTVPSGGIKDAVDPFLVQLAPTISDGTTIDFDVVVSDDSKTDYASEWGLLTLAPELEPVEMDWGDWLYGDGDQNIEDNERVTIEVYLKNFGVGRADTVVGTLRTDDPSVTVYDSVVTYLGIDLLATAAGDTHYSYAEADVSVESWCWIDFVDNYGRTFRHDLMVRPPSVPDGLETDASHGADVIVLFWLPNHEPGNRGYNIYRSLIPAGPFTRVNEDLVDGISYYRDSGLALLTPYYYRVTSVDSSLVEGNPSLVVSQSTSPPELDPFPLPFSIETSSHCAVGDVNGDGRLDIVLAADEIYVWTDDGGELLDGDNNAQTHGPLTDLNSAFLAAGVALADLDGIAGKEIIASEEAWDAAGVQNAIHVFRYDGTEVPGWPKLLRQNGNGWNWSPPSVGDVDGDGSPEVVVNTLDGRTWVWHADGTELMDGDNDASTDGVFIFRTDWGQEWGTSGPSLFDLDGDGAKEIIFGSKYQVADNYLFAYKYDQSQAPGFPYFAGNGSITCSPTIADLNDDGTWEIIFICNDNAIHVVQQDGSTYSGYPRVCVNNSGTTCPSPAVGNFDGDDDLEIVAIATVNSTQANLYVFDTDIGGGTSGDILPGWPQSMPGNSEGSPVVGDINGDGAADILHGIGGGATESPNNLYAFEADGDPISGFPINLNGPLRPSPVVCDLDFDGDVDIIYGGWDLVIHVWDMPYAYDPYATPWRTFRGHSCRDGVHRRNSLIAVPEPVALTEFLLEQYPNPFNPTTTVRLHIPGAAGSRQQVQVQVFDIRGRLVSQLHEGPVNSGWQSWTWSGRDQAGRQQASGTYFLRAKIADQTLIHKMALIK